MGGRGTYASGNNVAYQWKTIAKIEGIKVLVGTNGQHKLPEEAHVSNAYARLNQDGTLRELRFYDTQHRLRFEIALHQEVNVDLSGKPVLHYHVYDITGKGKWHGEAQKATKAMRRRYGKYFGRSWK